MADTPKVLLTTVDGSVTLSESRERQSMYTDRPAQVLIAELLPDEYGIVICKYDASTNPPVNPAEGTYLSVVMDDAFRFSCKEAHHSIDIALLDCDSGDWSIHYHMEFEDEIDWFECVRLLTEGKAKHTLRRKRLRFKLEAAAAVGFEPEANMEVA